MAKIPENYLPPKELWPEFTVPEEFADTPRKLNLADFLLDRHIREGRADHIAIKFQNRVFTYGLLQTLVNKFANGLKTAGAESQDRIGIRLVNSPQALVTIFAIEKIGAIPVPTSPLWSSEELSFVVNDSEMKFLVANVSLIGPVEDAKQNFTEGTRVIVIGGNPEDVRRAGDLSFEEMSEQGSAGLEAEMLDEWDIGVILYTSGTTGMPKGCVHYIRPTAIVARMVNRYVYGLGPGDILGGAAPVSFAAGFGTFAIIPFEGGAAVSLLPRFSPADMMETIQKHQVTVLTGLPTAYRGLLRFPDFKKYDLSSIRLYTSGGDTLGAETFHLWKNLTGKPIWEGLGGTELLHLVTSNTMNREPVANSIGQALPGVVVRVLDPEGRECKPFDIGSILLKCPSGTIYWKSNINGSKLLDSQRAAVVDGWNRIGDAVYRDDKGNLFFVSREDDMIKTSGYRVSPAEVEAALARHPVIADVGVVGIPDVEKGQIIKAVVVLKQGYQADDRMSEEIRKFAKKSIAIYKLPRIFEYVESLPRTPTGKLLRRKLRNQPAQVSTRFPCVPAENTSS
ncbi:MAG: acyl-CoA synthetase [Desulfobacteraceae bacterium]|nr:acyl-CoA synthetase [Desulfobacteraceae bacterium]